MKQIEEDNFDCTREGFLERKRLAGIRVNSPIQSTSRESLLIAYIQGYLHVISGYSEINQRPFVAAESARIATKIRATFGRFNESNKDRCIAVIEAAMRSDPPKAPNIPRRVTQDDYVARVMREAEERRERDERLRQWFA